MGGTAHPPAKEQPAMTREEILRLTDLASCAG